VGREKVHLGLEKGVLLSDTDPHKARGCSWEEGKIMANG